MITVSYFSAGVSSAVATKLMIDQIDRIFYTHIDDQHPDTMRFVKDCEAWFGKPVEIWQSTLFKTVDEVCLGMHETKEAAALAYNVAAIKYFGEFALLNNVVDEHGKNPGWN
jgi:hypothetical protein